MEEKEVIVIESDDDVSDSAYIEIGGSDTDGCELPSLPSAVGIGNSRRVERASINGPPTPQHTSPTVSRRAFPETPTKAYSRPPGRLASLVRNTDTILGRIPNTPSTLAPSSSPRSINSAQPRISGKLNGVIPVKVEANTKTLRQKLDSTVAVKSNKSTLPTPSSVLPPNFLPAVKARVYSTSRPTSKPNTSLGLKKPESFGFVSAATLLPTTTTNWKVTTTPHALNGQNTIAAAKTPTPKITLEPVSKSVPKPKKQEEVHIMGSGRESFPRATRHPIAAPAVTATPVYKSMYKPINQKPIHNAPQPLPRTLEKLILTKRARTPSYSAGAYGDPYTISSDSDSDDYGNPNRTSQSPPSLKSFTETSDIHETASDVEVVLNQFPAWLDSPSPTELRSSYLDTSQSTTSSLLGKRLWGDTVGDGGRRVGRENRHVRLGEGDEFTASPVPAQRTTALSQSTSAVKRNTSLIGGTLSPSQLVRACAVTKQADSALKQNLFTKGDTFPLNRLTSTERTALLDRCSPFSPPVKKNTPMPYVETINLGSDLLNKDTNLDLDADSVNSLPDSRIKRQGITNREQRRKKKRTKKRSRRDPEGKVACRHRNRARDK